MASVKKCTKGPRHKWEWKKDVTNVSLSITASGTRRAFSRRGIFVCECGASKEGQPRTGL
jgi:hypothetical protein